MSQTLQPAPSSSASRGEFTIQPAYFTSSLFVDALREDIQQLIHLYSEAYSSARIRASQNLPSEIAGTSNAFRPFSLFKEIWTRQGWGLLHLKVLEPRARDSFLNVVLRLFLERIAPEEHSISQVVGLFGLYTFYMSQPSSSVPRIHSIGCIRIPIDMYEHLINFPSSLNDFEELKELRPHAQHIVQTLHSKSLFVILPRSNLCSQNPRHLPREIFQSTLADSASPNVTGKRKTGRPSKAEKAQKARAAVSNLEKWVESNTMSTKDLTSDPAGAPLDTDIFEGNILPYNIAEKEDIETTHRILSERPRTSLNDYRAKKSDMLSILGDSDPLLRANTRVLSRLKQIDAMAAERGLEVGGEGGDRSGLERVERAVSELKTRGKGILGLLEGAGLAENDKEVI